MHGKTTKTVKKSFSSKSASRHSRSFMDRGQGQMKMMVLVILVLLIAGAVVFFTRTLTGNQAMTTGSRASEFGGPIGKIRNDRKCLKPKGEIVGDTIYDGSHCIQFTRFTCPQGTQTQPTGYPDRGFYCTRAGYSGLKCDVSSPRGVCLTMDDINRWMMEVCGCAQYEPGTTGIRIDDPTPMRE